MRLNNPFLHESKRAVFRQETCQFHAHILQLEQVYLMVASESLTGLPSFRGTVCDVSRQGLLKKC
jgi:hypothetical protein